MSIFYAVFFILTHETKISSLIFGRLLCIFRVRNFVWLCVLFLLLCYVIAFRIPIIIRQKWGEKFEKSSRVLLMNRRAWSPAPTYFYYSTHCAGWLFSSSAQSFFRTNWKKSFYLLNNVSPSFSKNSYELNKNELYQRCSLIPLLDCLIDFVGLINSLNIHCLIDWL